MEAIVVPVLLGDLEVDFGPTFLGGVSAMSAVLDVLSVCTYY